MKPVIAIVVIPIGFCFAQEPSKPSFEVVSIRPTSGQPTVLASGMRVVGAMQGGPGTADPERLNGNGVTPFAMISRAFGLKRYQILGPPWINSTRYDLNAKIQPGATKEQVDLMFQSMLEDRFRLKIHHETQEHAAYNLTIAKGGVKLRGSMPTDTCAMGARPAGGTCPDTQYPTGIARSSDDSRPMATGCCAGATQQRLNGRSTPIATLANMIESQLGGPIVIDKTGLTGNYDYRIEFAALNGNPADDTPLPSLFEALEKDFGLKLESVKTSIDVVVVDHIEPASEN
jgi:uncharacterized protein (TIGR03435 family)